MEGSVKAVGKQRMTSCRMKRQHLGQCVRYYGRFECVWRPYCLTFQAQVATEHG